MGEQLPKRRKDKYNPYTISYSKDKLCHYLSFIDGQGEQHHFKISIPIYEMFNAFELEDLSMLNEFDRHIEHSELTEGTLNDRAENAPKSVEEIVYEHIRDEQLHTAISRLPEVQRRRLLLYYFAELTYEQIAEMEGCTIMPVKRSVDAAIEKLKIFLK